MIKDLADFPIIIDLKINWGDMDAFQHVNNVIYFRYFESARIASLEKLNYKELTKAENMGVILASVQAKFICPLFYPDTIKVGTRVPEIGEDSFTMDYALLSTSQNRIAAVGTSKIVTYDYAQNKKMAIPERFRELLETLR